MTDFALARRNMIDGQLRPNRVTNAPLLAVIGELPRERFLPDAMRSVAYADDDVPLGDGRYLMEPMVLARLIQALQPRPEDRALVVASGRGYGAALLARLVHSVVAVESAPLLLAAAEQTAKELSITGINRTAGKLEQGAAASAPYDVILIEGAVPGAKGGWITVRDAVKKAPPKDLPKPGKFRLAGENGAAAEAKEGGA